jgi:hypothetical protein
METDPVSEMLCSLVSKITDDGQSTPTRQLFTSRYNTNILTGNISDMFYPYLMKAS